jgi:hypothetical protein
VQISGSQAQVQATLQPAQVAPALLTQADMNGVMGASLLTPAVSARTGLGQFLPGQDVPRPESSGSAVMNQNLQRAQNGLPQVRSSSDCVRCGQAASRPRGRAATVSAVVRILHMVIAVAQVASW